MELDELKNLWKEENKKLESRIQLNEQLLKKMNFEKSIGEFDKLLKISITGRNLALVYFGISVLMASNFINEVEYSIPAIIGALAMLWSFISHLSIKKPDYVNSSIIDLQKVISKFRIHTAAHAKYDISIVSLWLLTLIPLYLKYFFDIPVYESNKNLGIFFLVLFLVIAIIILLSIKMYKKYELKLREAEASLGEIHEFEKAY